MQPSEKQPRLKTPDELELELSRRVIWFYRKIRRLEREIAESREQITDTLLRLDYVKVSRKDGGNEFSQDSLELLGKALGPFFPIWHKDEECVEKDEES